MKRKKTDSESYLIFLFFFGLAMGVFAVLAAAGCTPATVGDGKPCAIVQGACVLGERVEDQEFIAALVPVGGVDVLDGLTFEILPTCAGALLEPAVGLVRGTPATIAAALPTLRGYSVLQLPFHPLGELPACAFVDLP